LKLNTTSVAILIVALSIEISNWIKRKSLLLRVSGTKLYSDQLRSAILRAITLVSKITTL